LVKTGNWKKGEKDGKPKIGKNGPFLTTGMGGGGGVVVVVVVVPIFFLIPL
jgi:hypothetical protein